MYQPIVVEIKEELIEILTNINFFKDHDIKSLEFADKYFLDKLTEKFISGRIYDDDIFTDDEFEVCLKEIIAGSVLYELKKKGYINSYEDENTEEMFFLTEDGKEYLKNMKGNELI